MVTWERKPLRLGSIAPDFAAEATQGHIKFHDFISNSWVILFSHPADFTPVYTTKLGVVVHLQDKSEERNVKVIGFFDNGLESHRDKGTPITRTIRLMLSYPASTDRNFDEILHYCDNVISHPSVSNEEAEKLSPGFGTIKSYLRFAAQPGTQKA
ncbi:thioredoxin-like protein [Gamsiella multidivaricata]|uniref:thioredoxin-like protein n=1 Tax=Gamsiella multidivaricata TaxID=101098 RepID=UPI002220269B|nr:thioredoxin-like protein [Gamsiella multidivaricata]KAI7827403.1 thioredoxin-like protein [Gamsiella multidivaricata]